MSLFVRDRRQFDAMPPVPPFPGSDANGLVRPTTDSALQVSAVWACVRLLSDAVAMMPMTGFRIVDGQRVPAPTPQLFTSPSADATPPEWVYMVMVSLLLRGNLFGRILTRDRLGYPTQIDLLHPDQVNVTVDHETGKVAYRYKTQTLARDDVLHMRAFRFPGRVSGLSPVEYSAATISGSELAGKFGLDFFRNGAHPSAVLSTEQPLTKEQAKTAKDRFIEAVKDRQPAVLTGGLKYDAIQVKPEESQFLATMKFGVNEIARIFGVPPELIAGEAGNSMTYANVEQRSLDFLTYSVQPWLTRLESAFARLLPGTQHVRFDTSVLTRADFETLMRATAIGIASKQITPDESRALRDKPPLTSAQKDELALVPLTISPLGRPKTASPTEPPPAA